MNAVILIAGVARRLAPLTDTTHKALLPVGGRLWDRAFPFVDALALGCWAAAGAQKTLVVGLVRAALSRQSAGLRGEGRIRRGSVRIGRHGVRRHDTRLRRRARGHVTGVMDRGIGRRHGRPL